MTTDEKKALGTEGLAKNQDDQTILPQTSVQVAVSLKQYGLICVPKYPDGKASVVSGDAFDEFNYEPEQAAEKFAGFHAALKLKDSGCALLDLDHSSGLIFDALAPKTLTWGRGGLTTKALFRVSGEGLRKKYFLGDLGEVLSVHTGGTSPLPPGKSGKGALLEWREFRAPETISVAELNRLAGNVAALALLSSAWRPGIRHHLSVATSGLLLKTMNLSVEQAKAAMKAICALAKDGEIEERLTNVMSTANRIKAGQAVQGVSGIRDLLDPEGEGNPEDKKLLKALSDWIKEPLPGKQLHSFPAHASKDVSDAEIFFSQNGTQAAVALAFEQAYSSELRYVKAWGRWFRWDGRVWTDETTDLVFDYCRGMSIRFGGGSKAAGSATFMSGVERIARASRTFARQSSEWDADHYLLNTPAGTVDLLTNEMRPHRQEDHLTKMTRVAPSSDGGGRFLKFLDEITCGDKELAAFLQRALGACLSGAVEEHWLMFWVGSGRNGKNSLGDLVQFVLGDYAKTVPTSTLMAQGQHERHPTELANLMGCRLAVSSEVEGGAYWNEERINSLTGDTTISARFMRADHFEFPRRHKHVIYGNHRPQTRSATTALRSRLKIVPFRASFAGKEDPTLPQKLRAEAGYVLHWLLEGHAAWVASGRKVGTCKAVEEETADYFEAQSTVQKWVTESLDVEKQPSKPVSHYPQASLLFDDYVRWKKDRGETPTSMTRWGEEMRTLFGDKRTLTKKGYVYTGVSLAPLPGTPLGPTPYEIAELASQL